MNKNTYLATIMRLAYQVMLSTRYIGGKRNCAHFSNLYNEQDNTIQRIYVINLDRHNYRWRRIKRELNNLLDKFKNPISTLTRRFSAVDARYHNDSVSNNELIAQYSLADQLFVDPTPLPNSEFELKDQQIRMTQQEVAVALSHIGVWKLIANGNIAYTLVLEDDIIFRRSFSSKFDRAWSELMRIRNSSDDFDIVYLSYQEARTGAKKIQVTKELFKPIRGLWQLSGYVLSKKGALKLLSLLPVYGPVDMWMNLQFQKLNVFVTKRPMINQRLDFISSNSYSILPMLSKVGIITREKPSIYRNSPLPSPLIAVGEQGTGLTSLAMALSMLGYRCCSDITELPFKESKNLFEKNKGRIFEAYVNIGSISPHSVIELAQLYRSARFIITTRDERSLLDSESLYVDYKNNKFKQLILKLQNITSHVLVLPIKANDKWDHLCKFLKCDYPSFSYPTIEDKGKREFVPYLPWETTWNKTKIKKLLSDKSPWIVPQKKWVGIKLNEVIINSADNNSVLKISECFHSIDNKIWALRNDTFPSNLVLFRPNNFSIIKNKAILTIQREHCTVREFTSGAICSRVNYLYGRFATKVKPAKGSGLITGIFLHRDSPRQEIDIEFLGKDTTKVLLNVFYNPGCEGTKIEYGYRGTPVIMDLNFDASLDFHQYEIDWNQTRIRWFIDGELLYERANWDPTPIPHLPLQFNINLWYSRSKELAGKLDANNLPAKTEVSSIDIYT
jgi:GR25 family glycosyltransferase involved in LPS biosynthesis